MYTFFTPPPPVNLNILNYAINHSLLHMVQSEVLTSELVKPLLAGLRPSDVIPCSVNVWNGPIGYEEDLVNSPLRHQGS